LVQPQRFAITANSCYLDHAPAPRFKITAFAHRSYFNKCVVSEFTMPLFYRLAHIRRAFSAAILAAVKLPFSTPVWPQFTSGAGDVADPVQALRRQLTLD